MADIRPPADEAHSLDQRDRTASFSADRSTKSPPPPPPLASAASDAASTTAAENAPAPDANNDGADRSPAASSLAPSPAAQPGLNPELLKHVNGVLSSEVGPP